MDIRRYEETFNIIFDLETTNKIQENEMPMLEYIYTKLEEEFYTLNTNSKKLLKESGKIFDELDSTFTEEQKKLYEKYFEQKSEIIAEENRQFFMYGFLLAKRLKVETE